MKNNFLVTRRSLWFKKSPRIMAAMALAMVLLPACFSLERNIGEKKLYSLEAATMQEAISKPHPLPTLLVKEFNIAPMYTSNAFVYRRGNFQFENDYYNEFIIPPQRMITAAVKQALFDTRLFSPPLAVGEPADHRLQGSVVHIYGDFRKEERPMAVMEISITLDAMEKRIFSKKMEISSPTPGALIAGWNTLLEEIIGEFISGLGNG